MLCIFNKFTFNNFNVLLTISAVALQILAVGQCTMDTFILTAAEVN